MRTTTITYASQREGKEIIACIFEPDGKPKGILQVFHGLAEHMGRYTRFAEAMTKAGYLVCGADHLGHGVAVSEKERGFFAEENGWDTVIADGATLAEEVKERYPDIPYYIFGHSMGSFMARYIYLKGLIAADGIILSGTGNLSALIVKAGNAIAKLEAKRLGGKDRYSALVRDLALGGYDKPFKGEGVNAWISSIPEEVARYNSDPLCGFPVKVGMFLDMFGGIAYIIDPKNIAKADKEMPILLISGEKDPVGNMGKGVRAAYNAFCKAGVSDVSMQLYEGCRHELLNDICREKVIEDLLTWLSER